ncbi:MAG TPA: hypothetical protein VFS00_11675, partial [Polyangiaceae bacterium]|nr:hypothetical protein [Polyangiaceae bacterium]
CDENNEGWRAFTPHDGGSVMAYDECITGDPSDFKMSLTDEQGALAAYGAPGRFQRVEGPQVAYRSPMPLNDSLVQLEIPALRARAGSTFVAVLRGQSGADSVNLYVRLDRKAEVNQADGCKAELAIPGVPQVCRLEIPRERDALVHVGVKTAGASLKADGALSIIFVQAP